MTEPPSASRTRCARSTLIRVTRSAILGNLRLVDTKPLGQLPLGQALRDPEPDQQRLDARATREKSSGT